MIFRHAPLALILLLVGEAALAHSPIKGLDSFYAGFLHPVFVPAHVLSLLVLGVLVGQQGAKSLQPAVIVFLFATAGGLVLAGLGRGYDVTALLLAMAALIGLLVAWSRPLPLPVNVGAALVVGVLIGVDSAQDELVGRARIAALLGSGVAVYLLVLYALVFADYFSRHAWQRIGLRIVGSWAAAASLLVLALNLAPRSA
jgi:urease accessory protein